MTKLTELLADAAGDHDPSPLDPFALAAEATRRRTVRRRRRALAAAAATVAALMVTVPLLGGKERNIEPVQEPGHYQDVVLSRSEMERRCTEVLNARNGTTVEYVAGRAANGKAVPASEVRGYVETREGWAIQLAPEGSTVSDRPIEAAAPTGEHITATAAQLRLDGDRNICVIPQQDWIDRVSTQTSGIPTHPSAIALACSEAAGYDLTDWRVLETIRQKGASFPNPPISLDALLMSKNGRAAHCWLQSRGSSGIGMIPQPYRDGNGDPHIPANEVALDRRFSVLAPSIDSSMAIGVVPGLPDQWSIDIAAAGEIIVSLTTNQGSFAYALAGPIGIPNWTVRVRDANGDLVWEGPLRTRW